MIEFAQEEVEITEVMPEASQPELAPEPLCEDVLAEDVQAETPVAESAFRARRGVPVLRRDQRRGHGRGAGRLTAHREIGLGDGARVAV